MTRRLHVGAWLLAGAVVQALPAAAQEYPVREIRSICNFAAGTGADVVVRYYSDRLARALGKPVIVDNRPGANGNLATAALVKSKPDGYTIMITPASSTIAAAPHLFKSLPFDPIKDIAPVTTLLSLPFGFFVRADMPVNNMKELTEYLKKRPSHGTFGTSNNTGLVSAEIYKDRAGLNSLSVPYKSTPQALTDLLSGQLDFIAGDGTFINQQLKGGKIKLLAVTSGKRASAFPSVPTMAEEGFPGFDVTAWWGVVVPAGTPKPIIDRLEKEFNEIAASEETKAFLARAASDHLPGNQKMMAALIRTEMDRWAQYVKLARIEPQ